jgi:hypothetical protein
MSQYTDIEKLPEDGFAVMPLSMSRLTTPSQDPNACYKTIKDLGDKCERLTNDFIFLYTSGLYFNSSETAYKIRQKVTSQLIAHRRGMQRKIEEERRFIPRAFDYLTFDYVIANANDFQGLFSKLQDEYEKNDEFKEVVNSGLGDREVNEPNVRFLLEETVVSHIIREGMVEFPRTLVRKDRWRLIVYPDPDITLDEYVWENDLLPKNEENQNTFSDGIYDSQENVFVTFGT